jgi:hypothetical protein
LSFGHGAVCHSAVCGFWTSFWYLQYFLTLKNRKQCVKVGRHISNWQDIYKGVPQGSILGPILFKKNLNDIFYFI